MGDKDSVKSIWYYYLALESDLKETSRYVEPVDQDKVYSIEFYKIIILAATECESIMKLLCKEFTGNEGGTISEYKMVLLANIPGICSAEVYIPRAKGMRLRPFDGWNGAPLKWWDIYQECKHSRHAHFKDANYETAVYAMGALYILIFYLYKKVGGDYTRLTDSDYIHSSYTSSFRITESGDEFLP